MANLGFFVVGEPLCDLGTPSLAPITLLKIIEWLVADVTVAGSLNRAERDILGMIFDVFQPIQAAFVVGWGGTL